MLVLVGCLVMVAPALVLLAVRTAARRALGAGLGRLGAWSGTQRPWVTPHRFGRHFGGHGVFKRH